jgi:putative protease
MMNEPQRPELLAPAGNWDCATAAIENGANAIYFGLQTGFNARARAANFSIAELPELMQALHARNMAGYVTINTLVFTDELRQLQEHVCQIAEAGVDACLVQDIGAARLIKRICPALSIHASTQMTMTCSETIEAIEELGIDRVVLGRELSIAEIQKIHAATTMPLEVFVHGALCVAYSGQCLTSESLGGRSANRGQCAQACRLDYELSVDGVRKDLGDVKYLLSPQDLAAIDLLPQLIAAGVCSLKIEGRLKTPEYVANVVSQYRRAIDEAMAGSDYRADDSVLRDLELSFSRGFSPGWLEGNNHKRLVPGLSSSKRGVQVGTVQRLHRETLHVDLHRPLFRGDGIVLQGDRTKADRREGGEVGGRVFEIYQNGQRCESPATGLVEIQMQNGLLADAKVWVGQSIFQTDDPALAKRLKATYSTADPKYRLPIDVDIRVAVGESIEVACRVLGANGATVKEVDFLFEHDVEEARKHPLNEETLLSQLRRLGGSVYELRELQCQIVGQPMLPLSVLGKIRKHLISQLDAAMQRGYSAHVIQENPLDDMLNESRANNLIDAAGPSTLWVLCRSLLQLEQSIECGATHLYADFHDIRQYRTAVEIARAAGVEIYIASLRIHKPGETGLLKSLVKHEPDGVLVRNLAAMNYVAERHFPFVADFSLNVTNPLSADWLLQRGARRVTPSYDLNRDQMMELVGDVNTRSLEVVVHQHMPMFHMEHCVFCSVISPGTDKTNCGRPCDEHAVHLTDRIGVEHVLHADIGCRNTLYNGNAQSGAEVVQPLLKSGVENFRIELLADQPIEQTRQVIDLYRRLIAGQCSGADVWKALRADNRLGVTRGTLEQPRNPLAIL